jgi:hypothetical protein
MPAVWSRLYDPNRSPFLEYAVQNTAKQVVAETGFDPDTLQYLWDKYESHLPGRQRSKWKRKMYFYFMWRYLHMYPTNEQVPVVLWTREMILQKGKGITSYTLQNNVLHYLASLALVIDEVHWENRLSEWNHVELLPTRFTTIVDTFPVFVSESLDKKISKLTYQPKYEQNVFKIQVCHSSAAAVINGVVYSLASR